MGFNFRALGFCFQKTKVPVKHPSQSALVRVAFAVAFAAVVVVLVVVVVTFL